MKYVKSEKTSLGKYLLTIECTDSDLEMLEDIATVEVDMDSPKSMYVKFMKRVWKTFWLLWHIHDEKTTCTKRSCLYHKKSTSWSQCQSNLLSKCCKVEVTLSGPSPDFLGDEVESMFVGTCSYICSECKKDCDVMRKREKV